MAYDEALGVRVRAALPEGIELQERRMFGGLAFLVNGNMSVGIHRSDLVVRIPPGEAEAALSRPGVRVFDITGRPMKGWLLISPEGLEGDEALQGWVRRGVAYARSLPPKP